jgi:hypothetical protein
MAVIYIIVLESQIWYPQQKLNLAKLKLEGANPVTITTEELKAGFNKPKYLAKFLECVKGHNSVRARKPSHHLSPEEQVGVECKLECCCCKCFFFTYLIFPQACEL